jgi:hypothetical protein
VLGFSLRPGEEAFNEKLGCEVEVDYGSSAEDVYVSLARKLMIGGRSNFVLGEAGPHDSTSQFPSWVPNWSKSSQGWNLEWPSRNIGHKISGSTTVDIQAMEDNSQICVAGCRISTLKSVGTTSPWDFDSNGKYYYNQTDLDATGGPLETWQKEIQAFARSLGLYFTGETWFEAGWRTLIANSTLRTPIPASWIQNLESYYQISAHFISLDPGKIQGWHAKQVGDYLLFMEALKETMQGRVFGITENGWMGVFRKEAVSEDLICVFYGHITPFVIRPLASRSSETSEKGQNFQLVGHCYIHGIMDGKHLGNIKDREKEYFVLV